MSSIQGNGAFGGGAVTSEPSLNDKGSFSLLFRLIKSRVFYGVSLQKGLWKTCLFSLFAYFERSKSMDIYSISGQNGVRKTCIFLYIFAHSERSASIDMNSISGQTGVREACLFLYVSFVAVAPSLKSGPPTEHNENKLRIQDTSNISNTRCMLPSGTHSTNNKLGGAANNKDERSYIGYIYI